MPELDLEQLVGLSALPLVVIFLTDHVKKFYFGIRDWEGGTEWPLVADVIGVAFAAASWYAGYIPHDVVETVLGAVLVGLAGSLVTQKAYDMVGGNDSENVG